MSLCVVALCPVACLCRRAVSCCPVLYERNNLLSYYKSRYTEKSISNFSFLNKMGRNFVTHFMGNYLVNFLNAIPRKMYKNDTYLQLNIDRLKYELKNDTIPSIYVKVDGDRRFRAYVENTQDIIVKIDDLDESN